MAWVHSIMVVVGTALAVFVPGPSAEAGEKLVLAGLEKPVKVRTDELGVPHVYAKSDHDVFFVQGYLHARDRFFQMDASRRAAAGTLAELTGDFTDLEQDAKARVAGIRAAAQRSFDLLEPRELAVLQAYADGVNAWLATSPLPPEYETLEVTAVAPWNALDSIAIAKSGPLGDLVRDWERQETAAVQSYVDALGEAGAAALYPGDLGRFAPWVPRATLPDALGAPLGLARAPRRLPAGALAEAATSARRLDLLAKRPTLLAGARAHREVLRGSNAWGVAATHSANGRPLLAGDPHSAPVSAPSSGYENHLVVGNDPEAGALNVSGATAPGIPGIAWNGQNTRIAWSWTSFYPDTSDYFRDRLVRDDPGCPARLCIDSAGALHPVEERSESYRVNVLDGVPDNLADYTALVAGVDPAAVDVLSVPFRSFGPIVEVEDRSVLTGGPATETSVLTLQYSGLHGSRDAQALLAMLRAGDALEFGAALRDWSAIPAHFIVADVDGNLAYFGAAEIPLRADLEAGAPAGPPPWLIRDGSGPSNWVPDPAHSQGQAIPFAVLPPDELPHVVNPPAGFVANSNEDASGFVLDNDLLNQSRPSKPKAIHYLGDIGNRALRNGRVTALLREKIDAGEKLSLDDMKRIQANTHALHAELLVPHLLAAFEAAERPGAPAELAALAADPRVAEAVARLAAWDFSHPSGIPEGYDASDVDGVPEPVVSEAEAQASVAATLYEVWFTKLLVRFGSSIQALGLTPLRPAYTYVWLLSQQPFTGVGASGIDFFPEPASLPAPDRRDLLLLSTFEQALDALAGPAYAAAFGRSTDQDDYRWGKLNRMVFEHPLGGESSIPPAAGFADLAPSLPGVPRDGTWDVVNVANGFELPDGANAFAGSLLGSRFRLVTSPLRPSRSGSGMEAFGCLAGGAAGDPASPTYASQLGASLTVDYHEIAMTKKQVRKRAVTSERFVPPKPKAARANEGGLHASE